MKASISNLWCLVNTILQHVNDLHNLPLRIGTFIIIKHCPVIVEGKSLPLSQHRCLHIVSAILRGCILSLHRTQQEDFFSPTEHIESHSQYELFELQD